MGQTTNRIFMIRPMNFGFNEDTRESNVFQSDKGDLDPEEISRRAVEEFDALRVYRVR